MRRSARERFRKWAPLVSASFSPRKVELLLSVTTELQRVRFGPRLTEYSVELCKSARRLV
jgi:hypothetical protein